MDPNEAQLQKATNKVKTVTLQVLRTLGEKEEPHKQQTLQVTVLFADKTFCVNFHFLAHSKTNDFNSN